MRRRTWPDRLELQSAVHQYIEAFYRPRQHSTLNMLSQPATNSYDSPRSTVESNGSNKTNQRQQPTRSVTQTGQVHATSLLGRDEPRVPCAAVRWPLRLLPLQPPACHFRSLRSQT